MAGFCHSAPGSPGTWTASPRCVLPPTGGQGRFSHPSGQFLLPNSPDMRTVPEGGNGPMTGGIVIPFVQPGFARLPGARLNVLQGRSQEFRIMDVGSSLRHAHPAASPGCSSCSQLCPGLGPIAPPQNALSMEQSADCHSQSTPPSPRNPPPGHQMPSSTPHPTQRRSDGVLSSPNSLGKGGPAR